MPNPFSKNKRALFRVRNEIEKLPVPFHDIGAIGISGVLNERVIPIIIANLTDRPDLAELIRIHESSGAGDLNMQWGEPGREGFIRLIIEFVRPLECLALFDFDIIKYGAAVDSIFRSRALYIQSGTEETTISQNPGAPKVFCEIPSVGAEQQWQKLYKKHIFREFRRRGLSRAEAKRSTQEFIEETRSVDARMSQSLGSYRN